MPIDELLQTEQERHRKAFELYYALGEKRSYRRVAGQMNVSPSAVKLWGRSFAWRNRIQERDAQIARQVADRAIQTGIDEHDRNRKIVQMALMRLAKAISEGKIKMQMGDLDRLIRLQAFLDGVDGGDVSEQSKPELAAKYHQTLEKMTTAELRDSLKVLKAVEKGEIKVGDW